MTFTINDADMAPSTAEGTAVGATTLGFLPTLQVSTGMLAIVLANWDNVNTTSGETTLMAVSDNSTQAGAANTWTRAAESQYSLSAIRDGILNGVFYSVITRNILITDTVTVTVATSTGTVSRGATLCAFNRDASKTIAVAGTKTSRVAATDLYSLTLASDLASEEHLWIGHNAYEESTGGTNNADNGFGGPTGNITQGSQYWGTSGAGDGNTASRGGYKISTSVNETYAATGLTTADRSDVLVAFVEVGAAGGSAIDPLGTSGFFGA